MMNPASWNNLQGQSPPQQEGRGKIPNKRIEGQSKTEDLTISLSGSSTFAIDISSKTIDKSSESKTKSTELNESYCYQHLQDQQKRIEDTSKHAPHNTTLRLLKVFGSGEEVTWECYHQSHERSSKEKTNVDGP